MFKFGQHFGDPDENDLPVNDMHPVPCEFLEELDALRCLDTQEMEPIALLNTDAATA
ncbi:MAG: hypothetical protein H7175_02700 [Burkholderiales bacterium]|nr:hypothetical protein [Anaerolineae bacterium]